FQADTTQAAGIWSLQTRILLAQGGASQTFTPQWTQPPSLAPQPPIGLLPYDQTTPLTPMLSLSPSNSGDSNSNHEGGLSEQTSHTGNQISSTQQSRTHILSLPARNIGYRLPPKFIPNPSVSGTTIRFIMSQ
ncbi:hypothetical protein FS749_012483, partial [Ceratobasidium sp. UAMH 11750]